MAETLKKFKKQQNQFNVVIVKTMICGINSYLKFISSQHRIEQIAVPKRESGIVKEVITKEEYLKF
ncbi:MAG: hypothetical protein K2K41_02065 [Ruminiclostridium sp.]|nr:hypothetical protein [Ruminiclostridium sp.]